MVELETLRLEVDHYQHKVQHLENKLNASPIMADKRERNKNKLEKARETYEKHVQEVSTKMETITEGGWKSMIPIIIKWGEMDQMMALKEQQIFTNLTPILDGVRNTVIQYENNDAQFVDIPLDDDEPASLISTPCQHENQVNIMSHHEWPNDGYQGEEWTSHVGTSFSPRHFF